MTATTATLHTKKAGGPGAFCACNIEVLSIGSLHLNAPAVFVPPCFGRTSFLQTEPFQQKPVKTLRDTVCRTHFWNRRRSTCFGTRCLVFGHASPSLPTWLGGCVKSPATLQLHFGSFHTSSHPGSWLEQRRKCP